jgi:hypothetical protein
MRARFAYISSLGTTAILVAAALLMLAVVSAIVAFRGWPGGSGDAGQVHSVPLAPGGASKTVALVRRPSGVARGVERSGRAGGAASRAGASTAGLVKAEATGPRTVPGLVMVPVASAPMAPQPSGPGRGSQPQQVTSGPAPGDSPPDQPVPTGPVPGSGGGLPAVPPLPDSSSPAPPPSADQVTSMVGSVLTGNGPPPPLLPGDLADITTRVTSAAAGFR